MIPLFVISDDKLSCVYQALFLNGLKPWNAPIWFLLVLFFTKVLHSLLHTIKIPNWVIIAVSIAVSPFISPIESAPLMLNILPVSLSFCVLGIESRKALIVNKQQSVLNKRYIKIPFSAFFLLLSVIFGLVLNIRVSFASAAFGNFLYFYLGAIGGILFLCVVFMNIPLFKPLKQMLQHISYNSLFIMCFHYWIFRLFDSISNRLFYFSAWHYQSTIKALLMTAVTISLCMIIVFLVHKLNKKFPKTKFLFSCIGIR